MELPRELEDAIVAAPDDHEGYSVAADWLQQAGTPQGELIALQLAPKTNAILDRIIALRHQLLPPELERQGIEWRWGFIRGVAFVSLQDADEPRVLRELLASPLARFVQKLVVMGAGPRLAEAIVDAGPRALRCLRTLMLFMGDFRRHPFDLAKLSKAAPALRRLTLRIVRTRDELDLPVLEELVLDSNDAASAIVARSTLPRLHALQIANAGIDRVTPNSWLAPACLPALRSVGLTDDGSLDVETWRSSEIAAQLDQLDLYIAQQGISTERRLIIDRRPRGERSGFLVMVGRTQDPGKWIPITKDRFTIGAARTSDLRVYDRDARPLHAEIVLGTLTGRDGGEIHLNGHSIREAPLRSGDEVAIADHVFRYLEGDVDALVPELRRRYGLPSDVRGTPPA